MPKSLYAEQLKDSIYLEQIEYEKIDVPGGAAHYMPVSYKTQAKWSAEQQQDVDAWHGGKEQYMKPLSAQPILDALKAIEDFLFFDKTMNTNTSGTSDIYVSTQTYQDMIDSLTQSAFNTPQDNDLALAGNDEDDMDPILFSAKSNNWNTPDIIFEWLKPMGPIGLDPCANGYSHVPAFCSFIHPNANGLLESWANHKEGYAFVNPPYSKDKINPKGITAWVNKAVMEWQQNSVESILLVPARTDTVWFQSLMQVAGACCFIKGRVGFEQAISGHHPDPVVAKAPFPSALIYLGPRNILFCETLDSKGWCISQ